MYIILYSLLDAPIKNSPGCALVTSTTIQCPDRSTIVWTFDRKQLAESTSALSVICLDFEIKGVKFSREIVYLTRQKHVVGFPNICPCKIELLVTTRSRSNIIDLRRIACRYIFLVSSTALVLGEPVISV